MTAPLPPTRAHQAAMTLLVVFLLVFPKGGIKVAGVPVTWGYLLLGLAFLPFLYHLCIGSRRSFSAARLWVLAALVPFQLIIWYALMVNGVAGMGFAISLIASVFYLPVALVLILGMHLDRMDLAPLFRLIRLGVLLVAVYGIFLFFFRLHTGRFLEIPYLTVNAGDLGELENKYIDRGGVFKLISTYNNGNIYGVSLLILLPLYGWLERSVLRNGVVKLSLLLTLSRTVWAGLVVYELLRRSYIARLSARALGVLVLTLSALGVGVWYAVHHLLGVSASFLFDRRLGGRIGQWSAVESASLLPETPFLEILEIVYLSVLENFGMIGLAAFLVGMTAPLLLHLLRALPFAGTEYKRSLAAGLAVYLFVSMSDGAMLFIPVMAFYWFVVSLLLSPNASFQQWGSGAPGAPEGSGRATA